MRIIKNKYTLLKIALFMTIFSCDMTDGTHKYKTLRFTQADQQFSIVSFYLHMEEYIKLGKENRKQIDRIYKKYVYDPIWKDFASKGECSFLAKSLKNPIKDLQGLSSEITVLSKSGVEEIVKKALINISEVLRGPHTTVYLQVIDPIYKNYIPKNLQTGLVAHTFGSGRIFIAIDPTTSTWRDQLLKIVAHEYHHSVWISRNFKTVNFSLLEYLILEGRADSFSNLVYPNIESPWTNIFGRKKEQNIWHNIKNDLHNRDEYLNMKMAVGDKDIPFASAYTIGYRIMQEFLNNNPGMTILEWTDMAATEILLKSKYEEQLNKH